MGDPWHDAELVRRFRESADTADRRAPLNAALARIIASDPSMATLLGHAPPEQQLPVLLLAAIHFELLGSTDHELARWYPNLTDAPLPPDDPRLAATLRRFIEARTPSLLESLATRHVQTNEVGRTALIVAGLGDRTADLAGRPLAHLDVGASAGLNLLLPRLRYRFTDAHGSHRVGGPAEPTQTLELLADVRGHLVLPSQLPTVAERRGLDLQPIDLTDAASRRWIEACVWPDQTDRFHRLSRAIEIARVDPSPVVIGEAVDDLGRHIEELRHSGVPLITTTWMLNYLPDDRRRRFVAEIDRLGASGDLIWVFAEAPALTPGLPHAPHQVDDHRTAVTRVSWMNGERRVEHVAIAHPHGYWLHADPV